MKEGRTLPILLMLALAFHVLLGALRLPKKAFRDRMAQIARYEAEGPFRFFLARESPESAELLSWLDRNLPRDSIILFRGEWRGALELASALLQPRLLYEEQAAPAGAREIHGRPIARGRHPSLGGGVFVLVGKGSSLALELRR